MEEVGILEVALLVLASIACGGWLATSIAYYLATKRAIRILREERQAMANHMLSRTALQLSGLIEDRLSGKRRCSSDEFWEQEAKCRK